MFGFRFGFVRFRSPEVAQSNLDKVGGPGGIVSIDGRDVKVNYAHTKEQKQGKLAKVTGLILVSTFNWKGEI